MKPPRPLNAIRSGRSRAADPEWFAALPHTEVPRLQEMLRDDRIGLLADVNGGTPQAIAAFASLHIAMSFTALLAAYMLRLGKRVKQALWAWLVSVHGESVA